MSIVGFCKGKGPSGFGYDSTADDATGGLDLSGKTVLITGCGSGLGAETMRVLCRRGALVIGAARTLESATEACARASGKTIPIACDLSEPASVRRAVRSVAQLDRPLDATIANAGIMAPPQLERKHGYELQFLTNHVGHHLLITRLLHQLSATGRVVVVSSSLHAAAPPGGIQFDNLSGEKGYDPWTAYGQSKLANLLFAKQLATLLPSREQTANAVHPGVIRTGLQRHLGLPMLAAFSVLGPLFMKDVTRGAATQCYVAANPATASLRGEYFVDCNVAEASRDARDASLAARLWARTEEIIAKLQ